MTQNSGQKLCRSCGSNPCLQWPDCIMLLLEKRLATAKTAIKKLRIQLDTAERIMGAEWQYKVFGLERVNQRKNIDFLGKTSSAEDRKCDETDKIQ